MGLCWKRTMADGLKDDVREAHLAEKHIIHIG